MLIKNAATVPIISPAMVPPRIELIITNKPMSIAAGKNP
jgi:hypothetical protein